MKKRRTEDDSIAVGGSMVSSATADFLSDFPGNLVTLTRAGMPSSVVETAARYMKMPRVLLVESIGLTRSTIERRISNKEPLTPSESDRIYRLEKIAKRALAVFEEDDAARQWLKTGNRTLGGVTPLSLLDTDAGADQVLEVLGRIEHGLPA